MNIYLRYKHMQGKKEKNKFCHEHSLNEKAL